MSHAILVTVAVFVVIVAAVTDLRCGQIFNRLTFPAMLLGLAIRGVCGSLAELVEGVIGLLICAAVPGLVYKCSRGVAIGGGDIKLFAAIGSLLGPMAGLEVELSAFMLLGCYAALRLAYAGQLVRTLAASARVAVALIAPSRAASKNASTLALTEMRMGPAIAVAVATVLALPYASRWLPWLG